MLTLTPVVCVCGGIVVSNILSTYLNLERPEPETPIESRQRQRSGSLPPTSQTTGIHPTFEGVYIGIFHVASKMVVVISFAVYLALFVRHSTYVTSTAYSSPSVVLASRMADGSQYIIDDYREAYYWLRMNTPNDARVMSW
jgi:dolichyl-diphosphooligosaccharide--protein glycosyltransferase